MERLIKVVMLRIPNGEGCILVQVGSAEDGHMMPEYRLPGRRLLKHESIGMATTLIFHSDMMQ